MRFEFFIFNYIFTLSKIVSPLPSSPVPPPISVWLKTEVKIKFCRKLYISTIASVLMHVCRYNNQFNNLVTTKHFWKYNYYKRRRRTRMMIIFLIIQTMTMRKDYYGEKRKMASWSEGKFFPHDQGIFYYYYDICRDEKFLVGHFCLYVVLNGLNFFSLSFF